MKKMGRPKIIEGKKDIQVMVRLDSDLETKLDFLCKKKKKSKAGTIRSLIQKGFISVIENRKSGYTPIYLLFSWV